MGSLLYGAVEQGKSRVDLTCHEQVAIEHHCISAPSSVEGSAAHQTEEVLSLPCQ
jgi:hypothetical protein